MSIIIRTIHNASSVTLDLFVPGYDTIKPTLTVAPSVTLDLFTVLTTDELETIQNQLNSFVAAGDMTVIATVDTATFNPVAGATGTVNSGTQYQLGYYATTGSSISGLTLITASSALVSDSHGLPIASSATATELGFVHGVTSAIQTQLNTKLTSGTNEVHPNDISTVSTDNFAFPAHISVVNELDVNGVANATVRVIGGSSNSIYFGEISGHQGLFDGSADPSLIVSSTGNIATGVVSPDPSAQLDVTSTTRGFLPPRMTSTNKTSISSPATGLVVYDTTLNKLCVWTGATWETVTSA